MPGTNTVLLALGALTSLTAAQSTNSTGECHVPADPDILGLGVRLGLYFQLVSTFLLTLPREKEARDTLVSSEFFFSGFIVAVIYSVVTQSLPPGAIIACTWYPILLWVALFYSEQKDPETHPGGRFLWAFVVWFASGGLNIWFWFWGVYTVHEGQCQEPRVFLFANLSALGWTRIFFAFWSVLFLVFFVSSFIYAAVADVWASPRKVEDMEGHPAETADSVGKLAEATTAVELTSLNERNSGPSVPPNSQSGNTAPVTVIQATQDDEAAQRLLNAPPETEAPGANESPQKDDRIDRLIGCLVFLGFYIIASELQLAWNHLDGINKVNSTGQIIPLTIGTLSLVRSLWLLKYSKWAGNVKEKVKDAKGVNNRPSREGTERGSESPGGIRKAATV